MGSYTPRRMPKRFLDGAPDGVLDIIDHPDSFDRYTVFYRYTFEHRGTDYLYYRGMSTHPTHPQGFGIMDEITRWNAADYRTRSRRHRIAWSELPPDVRSVVRADCAAFDIEAERHVQP